MAFLAIFFFRTLLTRNTYVTDHCASADRLKYERDRLYKGIGEMISNFDAELRVLRHEKFNLDIDLKNADLRYARARVCSCL